MLNMRNMDLASEAIDTLEASPIPASQARNRCHAHILRGKIFGLLLRKRRLAVGYALFLLSNANGTFRRAGVHTDNARADTSNRWRA